MHSLLESFRDFLGKLIETYGSPVASRFCAPIGMDLRDLMWARSQLDKFVGAGDLPVEDEYRLLEAFELLLRYLRQGLGGDNHKELKHLHNRVLHFLGKDYRAKPLRNTQIPNCFLERELISIVSSAALVASQH